MKSLVPVWTILWIHKKLKQDSVGIQQLRDEGVLKADSKDKTNILGKQFQSVFTQEDTVIYQLNHPYHIQACWKSRYKERGWQNFYQTSMQTKQQAQMNYRPYKKTLIDACIRWNQVAPWYIVLSVGLVFRFVLFLACVSTTLLCVCCGDEVSIRINGSPELSRFDRELKLFGLSILWKLSKRDEAKFGMPRE